MGMVKKKSLGLKKSRSVRSYNIALLVLTDALDAFRLSLKNEVKRLAKTAQTPKVFQGQTKSKSNFYLFFDK